MLTMLVSRTDMNTPAINTTSGSPQPLAAGGVGGGAVLDGGGAVVGGGGAVVGGGGGRWWFGASAWLAGNSSMQPRVRQHPRVRNRVRKSCLLATSRYQELKMRDRVSACSMTRPAYEHPAPRTPPRAAGAVNAATSYAPRSTRPYSTSYGNTASPR